MNVKLISLFGKIGIILSVSFTLLFAGSAQSFAEENTNQDPATSFLTDEANQFENATSEISQKQKNELLHLTKKKIKDGEIQLNSLKESQLDFENSLAVQLNDGNFLIQVHAKGSTGFEPITGVSIILGKDNKVTSTYELFLNLLNSETASFKTWENGKAKFNEVLEKPDVQPQWSFNWGTFNNCLASAGVPWATITVLGILCGAACVGTAGIACAPCFYAEGSIAGGTLGWCIGKATKR